eukprot:4850521-Prorocentrum_lima.AAC.1
MQGGSKNMVLRLQTRSGRIGWEKTNSKGAKQWNMKVQSVRQDIDIRPGTPTADKLAEISEQKM